MRIHIDCDVLLDVALGRQPFTKASGWILDWAQANPGQASVAWHSVANLIYLLREDPKPFLKALCGFVVLSETGNVDLEWALTLGMKDLEDAMQAAAARRSGALWIVTRNLDDYTLSPIKAIHPQSLQENPGLLHGSRIP